MVAKEGKAAKQKKPFNLAKWAKSREGQKTIIVLAFVFIPLLLLVVFTYLPFAEMVKFSFYKMKYATPVEREEDSLNSLNADSELNINASGDSKLQELIEHAASQDMTFDEIMDDWNQKWADAQDTEGVEVTE